MRSTTRITLISVLVTLVICIFLAAPIFALLTQSTQFSDGLSVRARDPQRGRAGSPTEQRDQSAGSPRAVQDLGRGATPAGVPAFSWSRFALTAIAPSVSSLTP